MSSFLQGLQYLRINYFDLFVVIFLGIGLVRGRKRGMSEELLDVFQWLIIVVVAGLYYRPVGNILASYTKMGQATAYLVTYLAWLVVVKAFFSGVKRIVGEKLVQSDTFGRLEYYLGMVAGAVRYACMLLVALALLNAKYISPQQREYLSRMQRENFGAVFFPTIASLQQNIFYESVSGSFIRVNFADQLIQPPGPAVYAPVRDDVYRKRERSVNEVFEESQKK